MQIPIASQTIEELREQLRSLQIQDERLNAAGSYRVHDYCARLLDEISRLRSIEQQRCLTTWHDHMPTELPDRMELDELTHLMGDRRG